MTALARTAGRQPGADMPGVVRRLWIAHHGRCEDPLAQAAKDCGLSLATAAHWKEQGLPDGRDWEQVRLEDAEGLAMAQQAAAGADRELRLHVEIVRAAEAQLGGVLTAISGVDLFAEPLPQGDDTREPVGVLYDRAGNEVRLGALRPKSTSEAVKALAMLEGILERGYDKIRELQEFGGVSDNERREIEAAVTRRFFAHVTEKWGEEMAKDLLGDFVEAEGVRVQGQSVLTEEDDEGED
ncbi:MAG: hypothetical protein WC683_13050 [bacterium]